MTLTSPLLDTTIAGASDILVNFTGDITLVDAASAMTKVTELVGNDVNNIGYNFVDAVNKDLKDNTSTYGELKNAFAKAKSRSKSSIFSM